MKTETIHALLDGKTVQFNVHNNSINYWEDLDIRNKEQYYLFASLFTDNDTYPLFRIKPEPKSIKVKIALMRNEKEFYTEVVNDYREAGDLEKNSNYFVKWLTDWVIYKFIP